MNTELRDFREIAVYKYVPVRSVMEVSGLSKSRVHQLIRSKKLDGFRISGVWLVEINSVKTLLDIMF